ncbi:MAG: hypothetical protein M3R30_01615 [Candidatus Eremiobacteraeota bacterium]|nr:hypothetical protein [Candidatus Eremiobacteraeota bacterium]
MLHLQILTASFRVHDETAGFDNWIAGADSWQRPLTSDIVGVGPYLADRYCLDARRDQRFGILRLVAIVNYEATNRGAPTSDEESSAA